MKFPNSFFSFSFSCFFPSFAFINFPQYSKRKSPFARGTKENTPYPNEKINKILNPSERM